MKRSVIYLIILLSGVLVSFNAQAFDISFIGSSHKILDYQGEKSTGLDKIYVIYDTSQLESILLNDVTASVKAERYSNLGGGYAEELPLRIEGTRAYIDRPEGDMGYIINDGDHPYYFWVVDYAQHYLTLDSAKADESQECENTRIIISGSGAAIHYYSIDGRQCTLSRGITLDYNNLEWSESSEYYNQISVQKEINYISNPVIITPPIYCNTYIHIAGDQFLKQWGQERGIESSLITPNGISCETIAEQTNTPEQDDDGPGLNIISSDTNGMGGSAPADISFKAYTTDAVIHNEWQIASDPDFEYIDYRFNEQNIDYTFDKEGQYYVRYIGSNADGSCETIGETYTISIGASELRIPNAFSPNGDGVNDEWKVGYRSLLTFKCSIFDRYGNEIITFNDPSQGWDGKYKGKTVKPGVYFYVIEATGADGKKYKKGGDINIIKSKKNSGSNGSNITE